MQVTWPTDERTAEHCTMAFLAELLGWWTLAIVKFLFLPWVMIIAAGKGYIETVVVASSGAAIGVYVISFFGERLFNYLSERERRRGKKVFSTTRRRLVGVKSRFGLTGLITISAFISVPISVLLAIKYFKHERLMREKMVLGFFVWANILSLLAFAVKNLFPDAQ